MSRKDKHNDHHAHQHDPALHHPPDIGSVLALARKKKNVTLADAGKVTRLPVRLLQALEENRPWEFPAHVYYRGSLQSYCDYLDLDFDALWREMRPEPAGAPAGASTTPQPSAAPSSESAQAAHPPQESSSSFPKFSSSLVIPVAIFALMLVTAALVRFTTHDKPAAPAVKRSAAPPPILEPVTPPSAQAPQQASAPKSGLELKLTPQQDVWLRLRVDKKLVFEGKLPAGSEKSWEGRESFWIRTPNPGRIKLKLNGREVELQDFPKDSYDNFNVSPELEGQVTPPAPAPADSAPQAPAPQAEQPGR